MAIIKEIDHDEALAFMSLHVLDIKKGVFAQFQERLRKVYTFKTNTANLKAFRTILGDKDEPVLITVDNFASDDSDKEYEPKLKFSFFD